MVVVQHGAMIEYVKPQGSILPALQFLSLIYSPEASKLQHDALLRRSGCHARYREVRLLKLKSMTRDLGDRRIPPRCDVTKSLCYLNSPYNFIETHPNKDPIIAELTSAGRMFRTILQAVNKFL